MRPSSRNPVVRVDANPGALGSKARALLGALLLFGLALSSGASAGAQWTSTCPKEASRLHFRLSSRVELRESLLPKGARRAARLEAIDQQLRFHQKALEAGWEKAGTQLVFPAKRPKVTLGKVTHGKSGHAYEVGRIEHPDVKIENAYIAAAVARGRLEKGEPAESVSYSAEWDGIACGSPPEGADALRAVAPLDPYLAFWMAPEAERRQIRWEGHASEFRLSPLFDTEFADIPDPFYAWYFWRPEAEGKDVSGKPFRGRELLREGENVVSSEVRVRKLGTVRPLALALPAAGLLRATVFFGIIDAKQAVWNPAATISPAKGQAAEWSAIQASLKKEMARDGLDRGSGYAIDFLLNLPHFLDLATLSYEYSSAEDLLRIEGTMPSSGRKLRLRFYFGPTDLLAGEPPRHWALAADALEHDDLVAYNGHSGLGQNFSAANIETFAKRKLKQRRDQLLAILSCFSYSYDSDFGKSRQLLLTGSDYTSARGPVGLLRWLDEGKAGAPLPFAEPGDFLLLRTN